VSAGRPWIILLVGLLVGLLVLGGCASKTGFRLNHDYPAPPSIKRLTEPGACRGGEALAARSLVLPKYPMFARRQGRQGWVVAQLDVLPNGQTSNVAVKQSAPEGIFDRSAIKAVRQWQFAPVGSTGLSNCLVFIDYRLGQVRIGR
jgi:periplasmic protein TonB